MRHDNVITGLSVSLFASTIPDGLISYGGRFIMAVILAAVSGAVTAAVKNALTRKPK